MADLERAQVTLNGKRLADVGCGEGITDLALLQQVAPDELIGYDIDAPTDVLRVAEEARSYGLPADLPASLRLEQSHPERIPAADSRFDVIVTWSAFEHVEKPVTLIREIRRVLCQKGVLFLQLYPFYYSAHGAHTWEWFPPFAHLERTVEELWAEVAEDPLGQLRANAHLNRLTLDGLQRALLAGGMRVTWVSVQSSRIKLSPSLEQFRFADLAMSGVRLLAVPI